ncbi:MAG: hypothetical protein IPM97_06475 [Bdellovibrionaceae bacterium]|nr:hypothetical protein [Pseudobdellovibrionaceae bacterium]
MLNGTFLTTVALLSLISFVPLAQAAPYTFNVDGVITNSAGVPLEAAAVTFRVEIKNSAETCILYREDQIVNMTGSNGFFSIAIGKTSNTVAGGATLEKVFSNQGVSIPGESCTHTPTSTESRKFVVSFNDGTTSQAFASQEIQSVPFALEAAQATKVGAYDAGSILKVDTSVSQTLNSNSALSQTHYDEFWRLVKNPSAAYLPNSTSLSGDVTGALSTNTVVKIQNQAVSATAPTNGQVLTFNGTAWAPTTPAASGVSSVVANLPLSVSGTSTSTLSISQAGTSTDGYLSSTDWNTFNAKQSSTLADAKVWVGNSANAATAVSISGDASIANTGVLTLATSGVTAGTYSKVTVDAKGRVTVGSAMASSDITAALGFTPVNKAGDVMVGNLSLASVTSDPAGLVAGDEGKMWYRSDLNTIRYWDGATAVSLGVAGSGITNMNGLTTSTQSFTTGSAGSDFGIASAGSQHTFNLPTASASNRGALSSADWTIFNAKQGSTLNSAQIWVGNSGNTATAVTLSGDATLDNAGALAIGAGKITAPMLSTGGVNAASSGVIIAGASGNLVNFACSTSGHVLKWSVTGWSCAFPDPSIPTLASGKIWVGNAGNAATEVTLSGDVSIDTAGVANLATTGVTAGTFTKVGVDAKGRVTVGSAMASSDITAALGFTPVNKAGDVMVGNLSLASVTSDPAGLVAGDEGKMWYRSDLNTIRYWDGTTLVVPVPISFSPLSALNIPLISPPLLHPSAELSPLLIGQSSMRNKDLP